MGEYETNHKISNIGKRISFLGFSHLNTSGLDLQGTRLFLTSVKVNGSQCQTKIREGNSDKKSVKTGTTEQSALLLTFQTTSKMKYTTLENIYKV